MGPFRILAYALSTLLVSGQISVLADETDSECYNPPYIEVEFDEGSTIRSETCAWVAFNTYACSLRDINNVPISASCPSQCPELSGCTTPAHTLEPTPAPTPEPTPAPTPGPTPEPTIRPTKKPTGAPTGSPTGSPTTNPTLTPTASPTVALSNLSSSKPSGASLPSSSTPAKPTAPAPSNPNQGSNPSIAITSIMNEGGGDPTHATSSGGSRDATSMQVLVVSTAILCLSMFFL